MKVWVVRLEAEEREQLRHMVRGGHAAAYKIRHANALLAVDESQDGPRLKDGEVARTLGMGVRSIESLRRRFVEEGLAAGRAFELEPWQRGVVANIFGWVRPDRTRRIRAVFWYVPRSNGKTPMAAGIGIVMTYGDGEVAAQNYCAAASREQAGLAFRHAEGMVRQNDLLLERSTISAGVGQRNIRDNVSNSFFRVLSSDADTAHGTKPHCCVVDELHAQPNRSLVDVLKTAMSSLNRRQPLMIYLTTADWMRESVCNEVYEYAKKVRDGLVREPSFLPVIYEADLADDWTQEEVWRKANPNYGVTVDPEYLKRYCAECRENPVEENTFKRLHLNIRTEQVNRALRMDRWMEAGVGADAIAWRKEALERLAGKLCVGGLDLGHSNDITAYVLLFREKGQKGESGLGQDLSPDSALSEPAPEMQAYSILPWFWVPEHGAFKKDSRHRDYYQTWIRQGFIELTEGEVTDYAFVKRRIIEINKRHLVREAAIDRAFYGYQICSELMAEGVKMFDFNQSDLNYAAPTKRFIELVTMGLLAHGNNPVLSWMAGNLAVKTSAKGNMFPVKPPGGNPYKIDGMVAAIMALARDMVLLTNKRSVYETRGVRRL